MHVITNPRFLIALVWLYSFKTEISAKNTYLYLTVCNLKMQREAAFTALQWERLDAIEI